MAQSKIMVNNETSQHELLNPKKIFVPSKQFSMRQKNITIVTSYRSPCSRWRVGFQRGLPNLVFGTLFSFFLNGGTFQS